MMHARRQGIQNTPPMGTTANGIWTRGGGMAACSL